MRIIKPYGRSIVKQYDVGNNTAGQDSTSRQRKIEKIFQERIKKIAQNDTGVTPCVETLKEQATGAERVKSIQDHATTDKKLVIAQWISVIDKIIAKPSGRREPVSAHAKVLRQILGAAAWAKLKTLEPFKTCADEKDEEWWDWKIAAHQSKTPKSIKGRWYKTFVGDDSKACSDAASEFAKELKLIVDKASAGEPVTLDSLDASGDKDKPYWENIQDWKKSIKKWNDRAIQAVNREDIENIKIDDVTISKDLAARFYKFFTGRAPGPKQAKKAITLTLTLTKMMAMIKVLEAQSADIAEKIECHLYDKAYRFVGASDNGSDTSSSSQKSRQHKKGIIERRANSIAKNVLKIVPKKSDKSAEKHDEAMADYNTQVPDIAQKIKQKIKDEIKQKIEDEIEKKIKYEIKKKNGKKQEITDKIKKKTLQQAANRKYHVYDIAVGELRQVWPSLFGDNVTTINEARQQNLLRFNMHSDIKETYKRLLKGRRHSKQKLENILPQNNDALFQLMEAQQNNQNINHLIRLGKVIHYEASAVGGIENYEFDPDTTEKSKFWTTEGQIIIKQNEALVRVWRSALAFAARTLKNWLDPNNDKIPGDILLFKKEYVPFFIKNKELFSSDHFISQAKILFGGGLEDDYEQLQGDCKKQEALCLFALKGIADLRHAAFHFKGMGTFINVIKEEDLADKNKSAQTEEDHGCKDLVESLYNKACTDRSEKRKQIMQGAHFFKFLGRTQTEEFKKKLDQPATSLAGKLLPLPRLKRVLERADKAWQGNYKLNLPAYKTAEEREHSEWWQCQYTAAKMLYDGPFKIWLGQLEEGKIREYINSALDRTRDEAQRINKCKGDEPIQPQIQAGIKRLTMPGKTITFEGFFFQLMAETATGMRVQNAYQSNKKKAQKQASYIEKFKCDVVALAFADYLKTVFKDVDNFCQAKREPKENGGVERDSLKKCDNSSNNGVSTASAAEAKYWQQKLYFLLHLMPVEMVNSLGHQLKKWQIVTRKSGRMEEQTVSENSDNIQEGGAQKTDKNQDNQEVEILKFIEVFELYIEMHDAQFVGANLSFLGDDVAWIKDDLFENEEVASEVFPELKHDETDNNKQHLPIRGLREMQRFGDKTALLKIYQNNKISSKDVAAWRKAEEKVADCHRELKRLHDDWADSSDKNNWCSKQCKNTHSQPGKESQTNGQAYCDALKQVEQYRHLTAQVMLQDHVRLHRLTMRILGRLIDFAGLWERDLYFILLAHFHDKKIRKPEELFKGKGWGKFCSGQVPAAFIKLKSDRELQSSENAKKGEGLKACVTRLFALKGIVPSGKNASKNNQGNTKMGPESFPEKLRRDHEEFKKQDAALKQQDHLAWIRNRFQHLAMLERGKLLNLTAEANHARQLMAYDRKLKNAVAKSIIEILARDNIELRWEMSNNHQLALKEDPKKPWFRPVYTIKAKHLGGVQITLQKKSDGKEEKTLITEQLCSQHFIDMVKVLFSEDNTSPTQQS